MGTWIQEDFWHVGQELNVVRAVPRLVQLKLMVKAFLPQIRQQEHAPAIKRPAIPATHGGWWQSAVRVVVHVHRHSELIQVGCTIYPIRSLPHILHSITV